MRKLFLIGALLLISLNGCASITDPARYHALRPNTPYWMDYDATRRGTLVLQGPAGHGMESCAEPSPDVAVQSVMSATANVPIQSANIDPQVQLQFQTSVVELANRTETIEYLRESMFRLCEQAANGNLLPADVKALYDTALKTSLALAAADAAKEQGKLADSLKDPKVQILFHQYIDTPAQSTANKQKP